MYPSRLKYLKHTPLAAARKQDLTGQRFHSLVVMQPDRIEEDDRWRKAWRCVCDCGAIKLYKTYDLNRGIVKSCGCLKRARAKTLVANRKKPYTDFSPTKDPLRS